MAKRKSMAETADHHLLYQASVQSPDVEIAFFENCYRSLRGAEPQLLREDFCGTALLASEWVKSDAQRRAIGVDLCGETLEWGWRHNIEPAGEEVATRIQLLQQNVLEVATDNADIICAFNFSYMIFKQRATLLEYFRQAHASLDENGLFFLDLLGGTETMDVADEFRDIEEDDLDFMYHWDQQSFNPINHDIECAIHFEFPDGSELQNAFVYNWRLWTLPELKDLLLEAGFRHVRFYWEEFEDDGDPDNEYLEGTGEYMEVEEVEQQESWLCYILAEK